MANTTLPPALIAHVRRQGGVFTTAQALHTGLSSYEISRLAAQGRFVRLRRGTYAAASALNIGPRDPRVAVVHESERTALRHLLLARAVALTLPSAQVLSHATAAVVHGLPSDGLDLSQVHVTHPLSCRATRREAGIWHHCGVLLDTDVTVANGLAVTDPIRTALDVARTNPTPGALVVADGVLRAGSTRASLLETLERQRDWPGSRAASRVVALANGRAESVGESLARLSFHEAGYPPSVLQLSLTTDLGEIRADFGWEAEQLVGEFDGRVKYGRLLKPGEETSDVVVRERQRELAIERAGWSVVRFTWADIHNPTLVVSRLQEALSRAASRRVA